MIQALFLFILKFFENCLFKRQEILPPVQTEQVVPHDRKIVHLCALGRTAADHDDSVIPDTRLRSNEIGLRYESRQFFNHLHAIIARIASAAVFQANHRSLLSDINR